MPNHGERLAAIEAEQKAQRAVLDEIHGDVKTLLAAHNAQSGARKTWAAVWAGLLTLGAGISGALFHHAK